MGPYRINNYFFTNKKMLWTNIFVTCIGINSFAIRFTNYAGSRSKALYDVLCICRTGVISGSNQIKSGFNQVKPHPNISCTLFFMSDSLPWNNLFRFCWPYFYFGPERGKELVQKNSKINFILLILNVPLLIKYIDRQQSILNSWLKPNGISDLLSIYNQSLSLVSVVLPIVIILVVVCSKSIPRIGRNQCSHFPELTTLVSIFLVTFATIFWVISHTSSMNIFYDRYFIPMEAAIIFLISLFFKFLLSFVPEFSNSSITTTITVIFSIMLLILNYNRNEFSLRKEINYHTLYF